MGAAYLEWERAQADKHEFHDGEVLTLASGSPRHNLLSSAVAAELRIATRPLGCHEAHDRGVKWAAYQRLASLTDYLMLAQSQVHVEPNGVGEVIVLANGARVDVDAIYVGAFDLESG